MIECKDFEYILAIAEYGTVSKAAEKLYISQPALTKYLHGLEDRLGLELFYHDRRPMTLSPVGELYVKYAKDIVIMKNSLENELAQQKTGYKEDLRVGFSCTEIRPYIFPATLLFRERFPEIKLTLQELRSREIEQGLIMDQLDVGFITMPNREPDVVAQFMLQEDILLGIPASHPLASIGVKGDAKEYPTVDLRHFSLEPFVLRAKGTRFTELTDHLFAQAGFDPQIAVTARNNFSAIEFAEVWGMCVLTTKTFISNLKNLDSMRFFVAGPIPEKLTIGVAYRKDRPLSMNSFRLLTILQEQIEANQR